MAERFYVILGPFSAGVDARNIADRENATVLSSDDLPEGLVRWLDQPAESLIPPDDEERGQGGDEVPHFEKRRLDG